MRPVTDPPDLSHRNFRNYLRTEGCSHNRATSRKRFAIAVWSSLAFFCLGVSCTNSDASKCSDELSCVAGYVCENSTCVPTTATFCQAPSDCRPGETCIATGICATGSCYDRGCVDGYRIVFDLPVGGERAVANLAADASASVWAIMFASSRSW